MNRKDILLEFAKKGFLLKPDAFELLENLKEEDIKKVLEKLIKKYSNLNLKIIGKKELEEVIGFSKKIIVERSSEKKKDIRKKITKDKNISLLQFVKKEESHKETVEEKEQKEELKKEEVEIIDKKERRISEEYDLSIEVLKTYDVNKEKPNIKTWTSYYLARLKHLTKLLKKHNEVSEVISINLALGKEEASIIGLVYEKKIRSNGNIRIILEDRTGKIPLIIRKDDELYQIAKDIPEDVVIYVSGRIKNGIMYPEKIIFPDIPYKQQKNFENEIYVAFTGDMQVGSRFFLKKEWELFIKWIKGEYGDRKMRELAKKIGFLIIPGDLVDGIGIYPEQEKELEILDIYKQYEYVEKTLLEIPESIQVVIIPGNHDAVRLAEPQPPIPKEFLPELYKMDNFHLLSNPSYFYIKDNNDKKLVLAYHGYSFDWFIANIESIRKKEGYEKISATMKFLLMLRHLSPVHGSSIYVPYSKEDPLVIDPVPDIFVSGHIHGTEVKNYKGVDLINSSCWQTLTPFQMEMGHIPDPAKVVLKNLKTGNLRIIKFVGK